MKVKILGFKVKELLAWQISGFLGDSWYISDCCVIVLCIVSMPVNIVYCMFVTMLIIISCFATYIIQPIVARFTSFTCTSNGATAAIVVEERHFAPRCARSQKPAVATSPMTSQLHGHRHRCATPPSTLHGWPFNVSTQLATRCTLENYTWRVLYVMPQNLRAMCYYINDVMSEIELVWNWVTFNTLFNSTKWWLTQPSFV